jgi:dTDP-4-amino-4,6-dideoxygalactose transaminase
VLFAHLFGARADLTPVIEFAERHTLDLIEDCAQAYVGPEFTGNPRSTLALFSFGTIKTGTAFGGAVAYARETELLAKMRGIQEKYPVQPRRFFLTRVLNYAGLQVFSYPTTFTMLCTAARWARIDFDRALHRALRGFRGDNLIGNIRHQASAPLLRLLERRLRTFDTRQITRRRERARQLIAGLPPDTRVAGDACDDHSYWVFPLIARDPGRLVEALRAAGFDATQTATLRVLAPAERIARAHPAIVYLPCYAEVPTKAIARLAAIVRQIDEDAAQRSAPAVHERLRL